MSKVCPDCGENLPDDAHFCGNCGYEFFKDNSIQKTGKNGGILSGKMVLVIIVILAIAAAAIFFTMGSGSNAPETPKEISMIITEVSGYSYDSDYDDKTYYSVYANALLSNVPSDLDGYILKTTYYDANGTRLGQETDTLKSVYSQEYSDYPFSFAFFDTNKKPHLEYVTVDIIKDGQTINNYTYKIDKSDIDFL